MNKCEQTINKMLFSKSKELSKQEQMFYENGCIKAEIYEQTINKYLFFCEQIK